VQATELQGAERDDKYALQDVADHPSYRAHAYRWNDAARVKVLATGAAGSHAAARSTGAVRTKRAGHRAKLNAPTRIIAAPANLPLTSPNGIVFSSRTKIAIAAIHRRFITPPTNSSPIRIQQQPTQ
jgi:hypothetical protein